MDFSKKDMYKRDSDSISKKELALENLSVGTKIEKIIIPQWERCFSDESGYGVYSCLDEEEREITIKGVFCSKLKIGQTYKVVGKVSLYNYSQHLTEKQISVDHIFISRPATRAGIISMLKTINGLKKRATIIYDHFGKESIDILLKEPEKISDSISGIGKKTALKWQKELIELHGFETILSTLFSYGLTPKQAKTLYDKYKEDLILEIEKNPYFLCKQVKGYAFKTCDRIAREMANNTGFQFDPNSNHRVTEGIIYLLKEGLAQGHCFLPKDILMSQIHKYLDIILSGEEIDALLKKERDSDGINYTIGEKTYSISKEELIYLRQSYKNNRYQKDKYAYTVCKIEELSIERSISELIRDNRITIENDNVYLTKYYNAEKNIAERISEILDNEILLKGNIETALKEYCEAQDIILEEKQKEAVLGFSNSMGGIYILNGSAGCGKTFTLKIILKMIELQYQNELKRVPKIVLMAPTGKASKVATKATNMKCSTIHRALIFDPTSGEFCHNEYNPLEGDIFVIDEGSMIDLLLFDSLLSAIPKNAKLIILGDTKQLPSVGAGNVLLDLIDSKKVKIVTLNVVKRQDGQSGIIKNANCIVDGEMIFSRNDTMDSFFMSAIGEDRIYNKLIASINRLLSLHSDWSMEDVQILSPQKKGALGVYYLNWLIQKEFNPVRNNEMSVRHMEFDLNNKKYRLDFRVRDKVIHTKNNYEVLWYMKENGIYKEMGEDFKGITNGETGVIDDIRKVNQSVEVIVKYDDFYIIYETFSELQLAYALTIHKSQGSQWPAVLMPTGKEQKYMLDNNLFYTGFTRAQCFSAVIGDEDSVRYAIRTNKSYKRYTNLSNQIKCIAS